MEVSGGTEVPDTQIEKKGFSGSLMAYWTINGPCKKVFCFEPFLSGKHCFRGLHKYLKVPPEYCIECIA